MACILSVMSPFAITVGAVLVLVLLGLSLWLVGRSTLKRNGRAEPEAPRRFDTTMGELRDLREALGTAGDTARSPQSTRSKSASAVSSRAASLVGDSPPV